MPTTASFNSNLSLDRAKDLVKGSLKAININSSNSRNDVESKEPMLDPTISSEQQGWTPYIILVGLVTVLGSSVSVGYNIGVMNTPAHIIKQFCNESVAANYNIQLSKSQLNTLWSTIVSIYLVGGMIGSLTGGWVADVCGRKGSVAVSNLLGVSAAVLFIGSRYACSAEMLLLGRFIVGLSSGLATCCVPMYLIEISPLAIRGAMGVLCPLGITVGVLLGQIMGLKFLLGVEQYWHILLGLYSLLIIVSSVGIPFLPESPKYLYVIKGKELQAVKELCRIRNVAGPDSLGAELLQLQQGRNETQGASEWSAKQVLCSPALRLPLLLVCCLQFGQQCSGINAVFYYSTTIFISAGLSHDNSQFATIGAGGVNLFVTVLAVFLLNKYGRRRLTLLSCSLAAICLTTLAISITYIKSVTWMPYFCIFTVLSYVFCYGFGLGPIPYFIGSELFEVGPRPVAMAIGSMSNWSGNFIIGMTFPWLQEIIGQYSFYLFSFTTVLLTLFAWRYLPETKGCQISDVAYMLRNGLRSKITSLPQYSSTRSPETT